MESLRKFAKRLSENKTITDQFATWNLKFEPELVKFEARTLVPEDILAGNDKIGKYQSPDNAEWSSMFRNFTLFKPVSSKKWIVVYYEDNRNVVQEFLRAFGQVSKNMNFRQVAHAQFTHLDIF